MAMTPTSSVHTDILLVGGGHTHALVLRAWAMNPLAGVRLSVVNPLPVSAYSGMLPGFVAGHYELGALELDLVRLCRFAGARLVLDRVSGIDPDARMAFFESRPPIRFDIASIDIGITSGLPDRADLGPGSLRVKPLDAFAAAWSGFVEAVAQGQAAPDCAVVGSGLGGLELALAMQHRLRGVAGDTPVRTALVEAAGQIAPGERKGLRRALEHALRRDGVSLHTGTPAVAQEGAELILQDGTRLPSAMTVIAAGARPAAWLEETGLALERGFVRVHPTLQSESHAHVFACGDIAHMSASPRPKAGVYAVRQAPVLLENLRAMAMGRALRPYRPQGDYLKLVSLGGRRAAACKWGVSLSGPGLWAWKDRIDRIFMQKFHDLPAMGAEEDTAHSPQAAPMLCGGCGSKVAARALAGALAGLPSPQRGDVETGAGDDAAVLVVGGQRQILTTDFFRAFCLDPFLLGEIAANHALGDVWAMGAEPQAALAQIVLPEMDAARQQAWLAEVLAAMTGVLRAAGADLVGGHSSLGAELAIGLSLTGIMAPGRAPVRLSGARAGDALILTKPIGTGVILAAEMRARAPGRVVAGAWQAMRRSGAQAARGLAPVAHAMTDVTGFGLAGHLGAMMEASGQSAQIALDAVPVLAGAEALAAQGVGSSLLAENLVFARTVAGAEAVRATARFALLFDPQTAGGLLAAVPGEAAHGVLTELAAAGVEAARIGVVTPRRADGALIAL